MAAGQQSLITRTQALACGLTARQIKHRVGAGRWIAVAPGVYRVASAPVTWQQRTLAACLAGPAGTVASHLSAAAVHGLVDPPSTPPSMPIRVAETAS